jgi:DNA gyrase subunit A
MHILEGLLIALNNLDEVIATIRKSPDADVAKTRLMTKFKLTDIQAQAILDMQLRRLAALEREKIEKEAKEVRALITYLEDLLAHPKKILKVIQDDLKQISDKFGDERRTRIAHDATEKLEEEDLQADVPVLISITQRGYVKRTQTSQYKTQGRGGRGVSGQGMKDEDEITMLIPARSLIKVRFTLKKPTNSRMPTAPTKVFPFKISFPSARMRRSPPLLLCQILTNPPISPWLPSMGKSSGWYCQNSPPFVPPV